jgi:hypothetical protein
MPRILIVTDENARLILAGHGDEIDGPMAEVVTMSSVDGIYAVSCTGDGIDECPDADDLAETWLNREDPTAWAIEHIRKHELRRF